MGVLNGLTIAVAGTLDYDNTQIKKWVEANGGRYAPSVSKHTTHLLASKAAWKDASDEVQKAVKHQAWVVTYDWLEDSLIKKRKLAEAKYSWEDKEQERRRSREVKKLGLLADAKRFRDGCEAASKATGKGTSQPRARAARRPRQSRSVLVGDMADVPFVTAAETLRRKREAREKKAAEQAAKKTSQNASSSSAASAASATSHTLTLTPSPPPPPPQAKNSLKDLYHYFLDATGFEYKILLARCDLPANTMQRYTLSILESHTKPNVYCTFIQYHPAGAAEASKESGGGGGCIQAVFDFNNTFRETGINIDEETVADTVASPSPPSSSSKADQTQHPEATRLHSLTLPPPPSIYLPYKTLLTPLSTPFAPAFRAFRHAFRDLTLLAWEERFALPRPLYRLRAARHGIEPFVYVRPKLGLPTGLAAQEGGLFCGRVLVKGGGEGMEGGEVVVEEDRMDEGYVRPAFPFLPALSAPLGGGVIGTAIKAERRERERKEEVKRRKAEERERGERKRLGQQGKGEKGKRKRYQGPLFDWWRTGEGEGGGETKRRRMFPAERRGLE